MKLRAVLLLALWLLGARPAPLVVGSVRDASGMPIAGARVRLSDAHGSRSTTTTAADGTFAAEMPSATEATITCDFCRPTTVPVDEDGRVIAIVPRYDAVASASISSADVRHVPSADAASTLALAPYVVLERGSSLLPGPSLSDRGLSPSGGLAIVDGTPAYDVVSELSPFYTIPNRYAGFVSAVPAQNAYVYDETASGGTFIVDAAPSASVSGRAAGGAQAAVPFAGGLAAAAFSSDRQARIARVSASAQAQAPFGAAGLGVGAASADVADAANDLSISTSSARVFVERANRVDANASAWFDRGAYDVDGTAPYAAAAWSDAALQLSVRGRAAIAPFAQVSYVHRSGWWRGLSEFSATLDETRAVAGASATTKAIDALIEAGSTRADFHSGASTPYELHDALASVTFHPTTAWSLESSLSTGYRLPSLLAQYASPLLPDNSYTDRDRTLETTLSYTDRSRVRVGVTAASRRTAGLDEGMTTAVGASLAWQVTPELSLRAWTLHVAPNVVARPVARFGVLQQAATPSVAWLTYAHRGMRVDAIWRRDLVDWLPSYHLDAAVSAPLGTRLEWFVSSERRLRSTGIDAGVRF